MTSASFDVGLHRVIAPTLETDRLILAPLAASRFEQHVANMSDPIVMRYLGTHGKIEERTDVWRRFCQGAGMWPLLGYGYWSAIDKESGRMIGLGGLAQFERGMPQLEGFVEAGWAFAHEAWGGGVATAFLKCILGWADETLTIPAIRCIISPDNGASIRVAEKNGFTLIDTSEDAHGAIGIYERITPQSPSDED